jgi:hypothetical protein
MSEAIQSAITQLNLAETQRNAGRDYVEVVVPGSMEIFMASRSGEELDRIALGNEHLFRYRFGFHANKAVRQQVLEIKQRYDMTDHDVRWLCRSTQMTIRNNQARISPDRITPAVGWLSFFALSFVCAGMIFQIEFSSAPAWKQLLGHLFVGGLWFGMAWVLKVLYIAPWRIMKRATIRVGSPTN